MSLSGSTIISEVHLSKRENSFDKNGTIKNAINISTMPTNKKPE